jgi:hypothetical protein
MSKKTHDEFYSNSEKVVSVLAQLSEHFYEPLQFGNRSKRDAVTVADVKKVKRVLAALGKLAKECGLDADDGSGSFLGTVKASYAELVEAFGEPRGGDGYKTEAKWEVELIPGAFATIYNHKNSRAYDSAMPDIRQVREWSVDGTDSDAIEWVKGMLGQETK